VFNGFQHSPPLPGNPPGVAAGGGLEHGHPLILVAHVALEVHLERGLT